MRSFIIFLFFAVSLTALGADPVKSNQHKDPTVTSHGNEVVVTGEPRGSTPHVLADLGLNNFANKEMLEQCVFGSQGMQLFPTQAKVTTEEWKAFSERLKLDEFKGKNVLSLGEGYSGFVPYLRAQGIKAYGLDLWYGEDSAIDLNARGAEFMKAYRARFGSKGSDILIPGDATDLSKSKHKDFPKGIPDGSMDAVFSRHLLGYLPLDQQKKMLEEAIRVTKPGGTIRIVHYLSHFEKEEKDTLAFLEMLKELQGTGNADVHAYGAQALCKWKAGQFDEAEDKDGKPLVLPKRTDTAPDLKSFQDLLMGDTVGLSQPGAASMLMILEIRKK